MSTSFRGAKTAADAVRDMVAAFIAHHGSKAGRDLAAEALGKKARWLRSLLAGESARVDAETYLRALEARQTIALERAARLRAELAEIEQEYAAHGHPHRHLDRALPCMDGAG